MVPVGQHVPPTVSVWSPSHSTAPAGQVSDSRAHEPVAVASRLRGMAPSAAAGLEANLALMICITDRATLSEEEVESAAVLYGRLKVRKTRNAEPNLELNIMTMSRNGR